MLRNLTFETQQLPPNNAQYLPPGSLCHGSCSLLFIFAFARAAPDTWRKLS